MQDSINTIISNALIVNKDILSKNIKPIITTKINTVKEEAI